MRTFLCEIWARRPAVHQYCMLILSLFVVMCLGYLLLFCVYQLPVEPLKEHMLSAYQKGYFEENHPRRSKDMVTGKRYDMWTECTGIGAALHDPIDIKDLFVIRYYGECTGLSHAAGEMFTVPPLYQYMRYTHGYLLALRPLYTFFEMQQVRIITMSIACILLLFLFLALKNKVSAAHAAVITLAFFLPCSPSMYIMTTHAIQFWLVLFAGITATYLRSSKGIFVFMGIVGALDAFITFLNMGSLSLSLPLLCYVLAAWARGEKTEKIIADFFWSSVAWSIGFLLPWLCKWGMLACIWQMEFEDIFSGKAAEYSPQSLDMIWVAIKNNVTTTHWEVWLPLFVLLLARRSKCRLRMPSGLWTILFPALVPFVWITLLPGQSGVKHSTFINLILWPTLAALALYLLAPDKKATLRSLVAWR